MGGWFKDLFKYGAAPFTGGTSIAFGGGTGNDGIDSILHKLPGIGGFVDDPAAKDKERMLHSLALAYQQQRPEMAQSRTNAFNQQLGAYKPTNNMLGQMYGQGAMADLEALGKNPMTPGLMNPDTGAIADIQKEIDRNRAREAERQRTQNPPTPIRYADGRGGR